MNDIQDSHVKTAIEYVAEALELNAHEINGEDTIETLEKWDSLSHMRLILLIEEKQEKPVDSDVILELFTIQGIADYLKTA